MTYQYDFFLSYSRKKPVGNWVRNHFWHELRQWLDSYTAQPARIFIDEDIEVGDFWPNHLESALRVSKYLIAIWSPQYFTSPWCRAEWAEAGRAQRIDFSDVNYPHLSFREAQKYLEFVDRMKRVSEMLAGWIEEREAPAFDPHWPIVRPEPGTPPVAPLPRIG
jgi:hypothetical protein